MSSLAHRLCKCRAASANPSSPVYSAWVRGQGERSVLAPCVLWYLEDTVGLDNRQSTIGVVVSCEKRQIEHRFPTHILKGSGRSGTSTTFGIPKAATSSERGRKGWTVTIHDLSGVTVAAACISTPFVSVKGAGKVSGRNPGAWLILRPDPGIISK